MGGVGGVEGVGGGEGVLMEVGEEVLYRKGSRKVGGARCIGNG